MLIFTTRAKDSQNAKILQSTLTNHYALTSVTKSGYFVHKFRLQIRPLEKNTFDLGGQDEIFKWTFTHKQHACTKHYVKY